MDPVFHHLSPRIDRFRSAPSLFIDIGVFKASQDPDVKAFFAEAPTDLSSTSYPDARATDEEPPSRSATRPIGLPWPIWAAPKHGPFDVYPR